MKIPSLGTPSLRMPGSDPEPEKQAPLPSYAPSLSKDGSSPSYMPSMSTGKLSAPVLDSPAFMQTASAQAQQQVSPSKPNFLSREAFAGLVWWQVILGGVGTLAISAGIASLIIGKKK